MQPLTVVIPSFNEEDRLPPTMAEVARYLADDGSWLPAQLIVVDDGSTDQTAAAAQAVALPPGVSLEVHRHARNRGKGAAVRTGFTAASGSQTLLCDADLSTPIEDLAVLAAAGDRSTVRIGSRAVDRTMITNPQPLYRDLMGRTFNLTVQALVLRGIHDSQCGFKLFPGDLGRSLAAVQRIDGFAFDVELLVLARRWGAAVVETPVRWRHVEASRVQPVRHSTQMLLDILRLWTRRLTGGLPSAPSGGPTNRAQGG
jgi:dolichyl-phosphate beta-glucosyltransferase